jgi:hypothetical protein
MPFGGMWCKPAARGYAIGVRRAASGSALREGGVPTIPPTMLIWSRHHAADVGKGAKMFGVTTILMSEEQKVATKLANSEWDCRRQGSPK